MSYLYRFKKMLVELFRFCFSSAETEYREGLNFERQKNYPRAAYYYQCAIERGHLKANTNLGLFLMQGKGVAQDKKRAYQHFLVSAKGGHARGIFNVATALERGDGVTKNITEASKWYKLAANYGDKEAVVRYEKLSEQKNKNEVKRNLCFRARP